MSYILDALQKAERERALGRVPDLASAQRPATVRRRSWPWLLGGLLVVVNLALVGIVLWPAGTPAPAAADTQSSDLGADAASTPPSPSRPGQTAAAEPVTAPPALLTVPWETDPLSRTATLPTAPAAGGALSTTDIRPPGAQARPASPSTAEAVPDRLPGNMASQMADLHIDALAFYEDDPGRSFALINLSRYRQGDRLREGPVLEAIERDGVVLSHQGRRFRVPLNP